MSAHSSVMRSRDTARGRPDMTAAGDGALVTGRDVVVVVVVGRVVAAGSTADTSGVLIGGGVVGATGCRGSPTQGGRKSKAWCMRMSGRSTRRESAPHRFSMNAA